MIRVARSFSRRLAKRSSSEQHTNGSDQFLSTILNGIGEGVVVINREFKITSANRGYCTQVKMPSGDIIGRRCYEISHHSGTPCYELDGGHECAVKRCFETGEHYRSIHIHHDSEGAVIHVETNAYPLKDPTGKVNAAVETVQDVTKRVEMEKQLQNTKEHYQNLCNDATDMVHTVDRDGIITACNITAANTLGYDVETLNGMPAIEIIAPESRQTFVKKLDVLMRSGFFEGELTYLSKGGKRISALVKARAVSDEAGGFLQSEEVSRDITEKKSLEAQLLHAQKLEAIGTLAGGVAHEFNNIITAITGFGSLLKNKIHDEPSKGYLAEILAASRRAEQLTRSLLAFGRKQSMIPARIDLNETVGRVEKLLMLVIGEDIELKTVLEDKELSVMADPVQIEQVLINLATNARDAMPSGGRLIIETDVATIDSEYIRLHGYGSEGTYARITTRDSGTGMNEATRARIYDPFFTTKESGKGTGLGLAIVYGIVKQHNGYIDCYSESGKGTIFNVYLPLLNERTGGTRPAGPDAFPRGNETVLVVEDSLPARSFLEAVLKEYGYTIITATDGEDAVKKFSDFADRIDLTILDIVMPKKNGTDVYEEIRRIKSDAKTLFMSGYAADSIRHKEILGKDLHYIPKPVSPGVLLKKMRTLLDS